MYVVFLVILIALLWPFPAEAKDDPTLVGPEKHCVKNFGYDIYLNGLKTGEMSRLETWHGGRAVISTKSSAGILGVRTEYKQHATLSWSEVQSSYLTTSFHQVVSGARSRNMQVSFSADGSQTQVNLDNVVGHFDNHGQPLRDVDTLSIQIRNLLMSGKTTFTLARQASRGIEQYDYQVLPKTQIIIMPWGLLDVIPVEQFGADRVTFWYAPSLDFHLAKTRYHGLFLNGNTELIEFSSTC